MYSPKWQALHTKMLITDIEQHIGSQNWSNNSEKNVERTAVLNLTAAELEDQKSWFQDLWRGALDVLQAMAVDAGRVDAQAVPEAD